MNSRRPVRAAQSLNAAVGQPESETRPHDPKANRDLIDQIRKALVEGRYFGAIIGEFGPGYSKLICPQKDDKSFPRTLVVVQSDMSVWVRHPHDGACDSIRRPIIVQPKDYEGKNIDELVLSKIEELHGSGPKPYNGPVRRLSF